jgi:hypothetical protein
LISWNVPHLHQSQTFLYYEILHMFKYVFKVFFFF